eukprot:11204638-Lingulodinium_polyedra.AAC.1
MLDALTRLQIRITRSAHAVAIVGLPPHVLDAIGRRAAGPHWAEDPRVEHSACKCELIPQSNLQARRRAMVNSPFGPR